MNSEQRNDSQNQSKKCDLIATKILEEMPLDIEFW